MDKSLIPSGHKYLCLSLARCLAAMLQDPVSQNEQAVLTCMQTIGPHLDLRRYQGLVHFRAGKYLDAVQVLNGLTDPETLAIFALCQNRLGEPSWLGIAQGIYESGDSNAIAMLQSWSGIFGISHEDLPVEPLPAWETTAQLSQTSPRPLRA